MWRLLFFVILSCYPYSNYAKDVVVISLTTTQDRVELLTETLHSLIDQTYRADRIIVNVGRNAYFDNDQGIRREHIPEEIYHLENLGFIEISWTQNLGPFTKLAPTLKKFYRDREAMIITVDDDLIYPEEFIEGLVRVSENWPDHVIAYRARRVLFNEEGRLRNHVDFPLASSNTCLIPSESPYILQGGYGVLYKPKFFEEAIFDYDKYLTWAPFTDDAWISAHLVRNNISAFITSLPEEEIRHSYHWFEKSLYFKYNIVGARDEALQKLQTYFIP